MEEQLTLERAPLLGHLQETKWSDQDDHLVLTHGRNLECAPLKVGVLFSGGPASGGNNVVLGLLEALLELNPKSECIGFLGGPSGILESRYRKLSKEQLEKYRNVGGFDLLGTGRTKIETAEQFEVAYRVIQELRLDGLVIIGGDDSNTNAHFLQESIRSKGGSCAVIGVPKTIDGDLKSHLVEISFGFDTACKVYSELIGNIGFDAKSSLKYWHFIKLMGRSASHVALECALETHPNIALISEEIAAKKLTLSQVVENLSSCIAERAQKGKNYGVVLIPEGVIEAIQEIKVLISELNRLLAKGESIESLTPESKACYESIPKRIREQLLEDRDPHGNVQVSKIDTEVLLSEMVKKICPVKVNVQHHFFGYEGRCSHPSLFDANYCYNLGIIAALLIRDRKGGVMAAMKKVARNVSDWEPIGVIIKSLLREEERKGQSRWVIAKALVDLKGPVFAEFAKQREAWRVEDAYQSPGPMQFYGPKKGLITKTLFFESAR